IAAPAEIFGSAECGKRPPFVRKARRAAACFFCPRPVGRLPKWPTGADCKSAGLRLRWFESITYHHFFTFSEKMPRRIPLCGSRRARRLAAFATSYGWSSQFQIDFKTSSPTLPLGQADADSRFVGFLSLRIVGWCR